MDKNRNTDWATEHIHGIPVHPVASIFPMMSGEELYDLAEDIRTNGLREPIVCAHMGDGFDDEVLIDGRNRYRACQLAGVEPKFRDLHTLPNVSADEGADFITEEAVASWILSQNLHRRHLTPSQRATLAVDYAKTLESAAYQRMIAGQANEPNPMESSPQGTVTDIAGKAMGVSGRTVRDAKYVQEHAPDDFERVRRGEVSVSSAAKRAREQVRSSQDAASSVLDVFDRVTEYAVVSRRMRRNMAEFVRLAEKLPEQINVADLDYLQEKLDEVRRAAETGDRDGAQVGTVISFRAGLNDRNTIDAG